MHPEKYRSLQVQSASGVKRTCPATQLTCAWHQYDRDCVTARQAPIYVAQRVTPDMGVDCCNHGTTFEGLSADYKRRLWIVIVINASMFLVEMGAGALAGSQALQADALDFLGDATTYGISLAVIGASIQIRARAAILK